MGDLTYWETTRTAPTLDLTAFQAARMAARIAREEERRTRLARIRALDAAAEESQRVKPRPPATVRAPKEKPTPKPPAKREPQVIPCTGGCGTPTRSQWFTEKQMPGTRPRYKDGMCRTCYLGTNPKQPGPSIVPCTNCGHPTRTNGYPLSAAPGTRRRTGKGLCAPCFSLDKKNTRNQETTP